MSEVEPDYTHSCIDIIDLSVKQSRVMEKQKGQRALGYRAFDKGDIFSLLSFEFLNDCMY